ncbi:MAG: hypothetical protein Q8L29_00120 [archaeon]|nr:hypothetical protein [archaeon]
MENVTLNKVYEKLVRLSREVEQMKHWMAEDFELADDVVLEIELSKKKPKKEFVSHEEMRKEFS